MSLAQAVRFRPGQIGKPLVLRCSREPEHHKKKTQSAENRHRPEAPAPHAHALVRASYHAEPHDDAANLGDKASAYRVGRVPDGHFRREFLRRNPERYQLCARREAGPLEELVEDQQYPKRPGKGGGAGCRCRRLRPSCRAEQSGNPRREAEGDIDERTREESEAEHLLRIHPVADDAVDELGQSVDDSAPEEEVAEHRLRNAAVLLKPGHCEGEVLAHEVEERVADHRGEKHPPLHAAKLAVDSRVFKKFHWRFSFP